MGCKNNKKRKIKAVLAHCFCYLKFKIIEEALTLIFIISNQ